MLSSLGKRILALFGGLSLLFVGVGSSAYLVQKIREGAETGASGPIDTKDTATVSVRYRIGTEQRTSHEDEFQYLVRGEGEYVTINDENSWNSFKNAVEQFTTGAESEVAAFPINESTALEEDTKFTGWASLVTGEPPREYWVTIEVGEKIYQETIDGGLCGGSKTNYYGTYRIGYQPPDDVERSYDYRNYEVQHTFEVKKGTAFDSSYFLSKVGLSGEEGNYHLSGFLLADEEGAPTDTPYLEEQPVMEDLDLYASFSLVAPEGGRPTVLDSFLASNQAEMVFNANPNSISNALVQDPTWFEPSKSVFLGRNGEPGEIPSGRTLAFGLNDGSPYRTGEGTGGTTDIEPDEPLYRVVLQEDLAVRGTLLFGSSYGEGTSSSGYQSFIQGDYVEFDLNGYDIIVEEGGLLDCRGIVVDSKGGGEVVLRGGRMTTIITIMDTCGGSNTLSHVNGDAFPYEAYLLPYFRVRLVIEYGGEGFGWGSVSAAAYVFAGLDQKFELSLDFLGDSNALFVLEGGTPGVSRVVIEGREAEGDFTEGERSSGLHRRTIITFEEAFCRMDQLTIDIITEIKTGGLDFPISPFFDILAQSSTIVFSQSVKFLPGSSFLADEDSLVILSYDSGEGRAARVSVLDKGTRYYDPVLGAIESKDTTIGSPSFAALLWTSDNFWDKFSSPRVKILGTLALQAGNRPVAPYTIAGPLDFARLAIIEGEDLTKPTYVSSLPGESPFQKAMGSYSHLEVKTSSFDILINNSDRHKRGFARPLVSYGVAYHETGNPEESLVGTYSFRTGAFESEGKTYFFDPGTTFQNNAGKDVSLVEASYGEDHVFHSDTKGDYIYFASSYYPYDSAAGTLSYGRINRSSPALPVTWNEEASRWRA